MSETNLPDHDLLVLTAERVFWIKESLQTYKDDVAKAQAAILKELKEHRIEIDALKKSKYYTAAVLATVLALAEFLSHVRSIFKF